MLSHSDKKNSPEKKTETPISFANLAEKPSKPMEVFMINNQLLDIKEFQVHCQLSLATLRRRIKDGSLKVWQPGGKGTRVKIYADNLLKSRGAKSLPPEITEINQNKEATNTRPRWLK